MKNIANFYSAYYDEKLQSEERLQMQKEVDRMIRVIREKVKEKSAEMIKAAKEMMEGKIEVIKEKIAGKLSGTVKAKRGKIFGVVLAAAVIKGGLKIFKERKLKKPIEAERKRLKKLRENWIEEFKRDRLEKLERKRLKGIDARDEELKKQFRRQVKAEKKRLKKLEGRWIEDFERKKKEKLRGQQFEKQKVSFNDLTEKTSKVEHTSTYSNCCKNKYDIQANI